MRDPALEALLASRPPALTAEVRRRLSDLRPCVLHDSIRLGERPLRGGFVDRLLRRAAPPVDGAATASKFGGLPYVERADELDGARFLGQVNFAEVTAALERQGFPVPAGVPRTGLLAVDVTGPSSIARVRWYPRPEDARAVAPAHLDWATKYEARPAFRGGWSLRGIDWFDGIETDDALWERMNELEVEGVDEDAWEGHRLFGHSSEALDEGLIPPREDARPVREYALVWRITYDNAAGFHWGTNWVYVLLHRDDLAAGAFDRAFVAIANA